MDYSPHFKAVLLAAQFLDGTESCSSWPAGGSRLVLYGWYMPLFCLPTSQLIFVSLMHTFIVRFI